jgi:trk system potassium uptake protein
MRLGVIVRTLGMLLVLFSATLVLPLFVSWLYADGELAHFSMVLAVSAVLGFALWLPLRRRSYTIRNRDGFVIVASLWAAMSLFGTLPFMLGLGMSFADALFESASGYTTTGSTVIIGLDGLSPSILFYRQQLQWLGGAGVIVMAIALLPMLRIGGMQLYKAETPGPFKEERITPRIAQTARNLYIIYVALTVVCAIAFWLAGMSPFDAIAHSMTTIATGGYSTHDASLAYFDSALIELIAMVFMIIGGISFSAHFIAWRTLRLARYREDAQVRAFLFMVLLLTVVSAFILYQTSYRDSPLEALRYAAFQVVSVVTTTGFATDDFSLWPLALPALLIFSSFVGGCAGSTSGGMKVIRFVVLGKQAAVHLHRLIHPHAVRPVIVDGRVVPESVIDGIWGFFAIYIGLFAAFMILLMLDGMDQVTAFGAVATGLNNLGPALGDVATNFVGASDLSKLVMVAAMLLGRLEIFTFLVLLMPAFWRR